MSVAHWFPVHPGKYLGNTMHLTTRQHGAYWLLILAAFEGKGHLPGTDAALIAITKLQPKEWKQDGPILKAFLTRQGEEWVHEYVLFEWTEAQARIDAKSKAGKEGAARRWQGRPNGKPKGDANSRPMADPSTSQGQTDAHLQEQEQGQEEVGDTGAPLVGRAREDLGKLEPVNSRDDGFEPVDDLKIPPFLRRHGVTTPRAFVIGLDWEPSPKARKDLEKSRPGLAPERVEARTAEFVRWCAETNKTSHNPDATWLTFMVKTHKQKPTDDPLGEWESPGTRAIAAAVARRYPNG
jgi:uncharacterized protein YdaU (DUF1376 family)